MKTRHFLLIKSVICCFLGYLLSRIRPLEENYFIIGSNYGGRIDPNAIAMIDYLVSRGRRVVFVSRSSIKSEAVYIKRGGVSAAYYFFSCDVCLYTHSLSDVIPYAHKLNSLKKLFSFPKMIFLQHGVIGLKSILPNGVLFSDYLKSLDATFDFMIVSSGIEKKIVESLGIDGKKLKVTGLPRFDMYEARNELNKNVLIFFTWQNGDSLINKVNNVLQSETASKLCNNGYQFFYALHDMQNSSHINFFCQEVSLDVGLQTCDLLITDDSSIAWDFFYRKQEVIFFKPSADWLVDNELLNARKCFDLEKLDERVDEILRGRYMPSYQFSDFYDDRNCERVYSLLL